MRHGDRGHGKTSHGREGRRAEGLLHRMAPVLDVDRSARLPFGMNTAW
jgi:hypothetical protein